jgi:hypothetical protein
VLCWQFASLIDERAEETREDKRAKQRAASPGARQSGEASDGRSRTDGVGTVLGGVGCHEDLERATAMAGGWHSGFG